ncbi:fructokinase ScrK [Dellaglioa sp. L3N]
MTKDLFGSIEAGGTKFVCAVGDEINGVKEQVTFPTTTPVETLDQTVAFFEKFPELKALAIGSFGPIELRQESAKYGYVTTTPKKGWTDTNFLGYLKKRFSFPIAFTTDVNSSAYGEYVSAKKAKQKVDSLVYYTFGTGVGAGAIVNGKMLGTIGHPEMGHVFVKRHPDDVDFEGVCPYHKDCLEGLAAGPTFEARTGKKGQFIPLTEPVWDIVAYYVAQAAVQQTLILRPNKIVFGGGIMSEAFLMKVREQFKGLLNGYVDVPNLEEYITMPMSEGNGSATLGNFALALKEYNK